jgi:competence ComEA-like helix-hairpin-helix protein
VNGAERERRAVGWKRNPIVASPQKLLASDGLDAAASHGVTDGENAGPSREGELFMNSFRFARLLVVTLTSVAVSFPLFAADSGAKKAKVPATESDSSRSTRSRSVDLNTADLATLESLPGIGPQTARTIIASRPFRSVNDLMSVPGIGPAKMEELKGLVTVSRVSATDDTVASTGTAKAKTDPSSTPGRTSSTPKDRANAKTEKVDINTADLATLESLPGVGTQTARAIVAARPFSSVDDLERVSGIGPAKLADLRDHVTASQRKGTAKKDDKRSTASTRSEKRESTIPPATPYEPATTPRSSRSSSSDRSLDPIDRDRGSSTFPGAPAASRVNLNTATLQELEALPEIGPVKAQAIIDARPFNSIEDVMRVKGIKEATFDAIRDRITVR